MSVAALIYLSEYSNMWNEYSNPNLAFLLALLILGIPFKPEKIMKYPNQWSVKPFCKHYCITVSFSGCSFTSSPGYMCCMSAPVNIPPTHTMVIL